MNLLHTIGLMTRAEHEAARNNAKIEVEAMRQACIELVRDQRQYEGSDYPVCNHIVHMIGQVAIPDYDATEIGDLPSRLMGWAGKARAKGREVIELDLATVDRIVATLAGETDWEAKFKRAATDLAAQAEEIERLKEILGNTEHRADTMTDELIALDAEVAALRPDAEAMRKKRAADRKRMAGKRNG